MDDRVFRERWDGFSLVEVVLAIGLVSFVLVSLVGLTSFGLENKHGSEMKLTAANTATQLLQERLAAPANPSFVIPALQNLGQYTSGTNALVTTANIAAGGVVATGGQAQFKLTSWIWIDTTTATDPASELVRIHLILSWPPNAPIAFPGNHYEVMTSAIIPQ